MGQGGNVTLVNGTPYDWHKLPGGHRYQMNSWDFPQVVPAWSARSSYVEFSQGIFEHTCDDSAWIEYKLAGTDHQFKLAAAACSFRILATPQNFSTYNAPAGSTIDLTWSHDGLIAFVLAGKSGKFSSTALDAAPAWMQQNLDVLGGLTLRQLCMTGSHDAGMSRIDGHTAFGYKCNTLTQVAPIGRQLELGSRYFDIRPVISKGQFLTGHYSRVDLIGSWQGANGESIDDIINGVNAFTAKNKELVVLNLSHDLDTDNGYRSLDQGQWNALIDKLLAGLKHVRLRDPSASVDLTTLTLNDFIGKGEASVVIVVQPANGDIVTCNWAVYPDAAYPLFNDYSKTDELGTMTSNQLDKMRRERPAPDSRCFLLSWTLTQGDKQAATCLLPGVDSVLDLAKIANEHIFETLYPQCTGSTYPNIIYLDRYDRSNYAALAMAINWRVQYANGYA